MRSLDGTKAVVKDRATQQVRTGTDVRAALVPFSPRDQTRWCYFGTVKTVLVFALATTIGVVYGGTIGGLWREWTSSPDASYGLLLTGVALVSIWARRADVARTLTTPQPTTTSGFVVLAAALLLYLVGQLGADVFLTRVSLV